MHHPGEPRWEGSEAEKLLKQDIDEKKHMDMTPKQLRASRPREYKRYNAVVDDDDGEDGDDEINNTLVL